MTTRTLPSGDILSFQWIPPQMEEIHFTRRPSPQKPVWRSGYRPRAIFVDGSMVLGLSVSGTNFDDFGRNWTLQVDEDRLGDAGVALEPPCGHQLIWQAVDSWNNRGSARMALGRLVSRTILDVSGGHGLNWQALEWPWNFLVDISWPDKSWNFGIVD